MDESELQDEPLQLRLMDHDTYSANDAIGKVVISLAPLLAREANNAKSTATPHGGIYKIESTSSFVTTRLLLNIVLASKNRENILLCVSRVVGYNYDANTQPLCNRNDFLYSCLIREQ